MVSIWTTIGGMMFEPRSNYVNMVLTTIPSSQIRKQRPEEQCDFPTETPNDCILTQTQVF